MTPPIPTPTVPEKEAALGRLTGSHAVTIADATAGLSNNAATAEALKIIRKLENLNVEAGTRLLQRCITKLQTSDLTINLKSNVFFGAPVTDSQYANCWQRGMGSGQRNDVERRLMDYEGTHAPAAKSVFPNFKDSSRKEKKADNNRLETVLDDIKARGDDTDLGALRASGYSGMRPKYAAVNFTGYPHGGAAVNAYGMSCFVLKNVLRFNATYTAEDSFFLPKKVSLAQYVATYLNMSPLIAHANRGLLKELVKSTKSAYQAPKSLPTQSDNADQVLYFEAQLHCDVNFDRDIELLIISQQELNGVVDKKIRKKILTHIEDFVKTFKIPLREI